ncbi:MAG: hypothetical protein H0U79_09150 [Solirubrobacterales bacterium]|nr:hypothetical protein [Solirubrobacterales bacterium]
MRSDNEGDPQRVTFDAMNIPARVPLLAAAGLPFLQRDNEGSIMATQALARERDLGLQFSSMEELAAGLRDAARLEDLRRSVWRQRDVFTFDAHADRLVEFFRQAARGR